MTEFMKNPFRTEGQKEGKSPMSSERRNYRRIPLGATVAFQELSFQGGTPTATTVYKDVSAGGLLVHSPREHPLGTLLKLEVRIPGLLRQNHFGPSADPDPRPLVAVGQVVRVEQMDEGGYELGVKFMNVYPEDQAALLKLIEASAEAEDNQATPLT